MSKIYGTPIGVATIPKVFQLELEDGTVLEGVVAEEAPVITATANDVRKGKTVITSAGVIEGEKDIPAYHTTEAVQIIPAGCALSISMPGLNLYDYTKLQIIICAFNTSLSNSVAAEKVVINDNVYEVGRTEKISTVSKNDTNKSIELGITNDGETPLILRYFTYKEIE